MELWNNPKRKFVINVGMDVTKRFEIIVSLPTTINPSRSNILCDAHIEDVDPNDLLDWSNATIEEIED